MIPKTKHGDCSNPECNAKDTSVIKVGRNLFCVKCRNKQKALSQLTKTQKSTISRKLHKVQKQTLSLEEEERMNLVFDLDAVVSKYIRAREASPSGINTCFTCGAISDWKSLDCGHYINRAYSKLRWDIRNLKPQCKKCNRIKYGNIEEYKDRLEEETPGITDTLFEESREQHKWSRQELKEMLIDYRKKLKIVMSKFQNE